MALKLVFNPINAKFDLVQDLTGYLTAETDPVFSQWLSDTPPLYPGGWYDTAQSSVGVSGFNNDSGYLTYGSTISYAESAGYASSADYAGSASYASSADYANYASSADYWGGYGFPSIYAAGFLHTDEYGNLSWDAVDTSGLVPYTGASSDLDMGSQAITTTGYITGELAKVTDSEPSTQEGDLWLDTDEDPSTEFDVTKITNLTTNGFVKTKSSDGTLEVVTDTYLTTGFVDRGDPSAADFTQASLTTDATWRDLDLSAIVPDGAKAVCLYVNVVDDTVNYVGFRKNGNSNANNISIVRAQVANVAVAGILTVELSSARVIEYIASNVTFTTIAITVKGWWL
jgi:hypothetical protein